jgi:thiamine-monophosphate kinase
MQLLSSTDMLLEDVHFRRSWHDPFRLGRKSLAVSISDIAAMGGIPRWALLSLALPCDLSLEFVDEFMRGFLSIASEYGVVLIGGDTCSSRTGLTISVTVLGEQYPERIVKRSGALPDDDIWVTGMLGDAALGLKLLESGEPVSDELTCRLLDPTPRISAAQGLAEAGLATSMIDISDGVRADFGHIAEQSGVGGRINLGDLPLSPAFRNQTGELPALTYQLALSGGEDYEICFTAHHSNREKIADFAKKSGNAVTRIGIVTSFPEVQVINTDGSIYRSSTEGFNHFT